MAENFKTDFFTDRIGRGIQDIFQAQLDIATKRIYQKGRSESGGEGKSVGLGGRRIHKKKKKEDKEGTRCCILSHRSRQLQRLSAYDARLCS